MSSAERRAVGDPGATVERVIKDYFCLADRRTAALVHRSGRCDFWCWPSFDSPMRLAGLLDPAQGGSVGVGLPSDQAAEAGWAGDSMVMSLRSGAGVEIRIALVDDGAGRSALAWLVEGPIGAEVWLTLGSPSAGGGPAWSRELRGASLPAGGANDGPGGPLALVSSVLLRPRSAGFQAEIPEPGIGIWLGAPLRSEVLPPVLTQAREAPESAVRALGRALSDQVVADESWLRRVHGHRRPLEPLPSPAARSLDRSLLTLRALQDRTSGLLVASPLTSIPQWPSSVRAWDYRYAWLRDCADAGMALSRAGAESEAERLGSGLGQLLASAPEAPPPVRRLSGGQLPQEHFADYLEGFGGARVRIGNAAADQAQLDSLGEVVRLAEQLDRAGDCPPELLANVPRFASAAAQTWRLPDHGIWEVRGEPRHYVHSKVMAWAALQSAAGMAERGHVTGDSESWRKVAADIAAAVASRGSGPNGQLIMSFEDPSPDSSLLAAYLVGFIGPSTANSASTLDVVSAELGEGPLMNRYSGERDGIASPCFPFIFPGFWAASAEVLLGRRAAAVSRFMAISDLAGPAGQLSEVAEPVTGALWGNYPQVQSHSALIEAALSIWPQGGSSPDRDSD
ncbi:MAG: glycoside hydrolase family 15 protein [Candidatus Dormiibacterota bacterium]